MQSARYTGVFGDEVRNPTNLFYVFSGKKQRRLNRLHNIETLRAHLLKEREVCRGSFEERES